MEIDIDNNTFEISTPIRLQCWRPSSRQLTPEDSFFSAGNSLCQLHFNKYTCLSSEDPDPQNIIMSNFECRQPNCSKTFESLFSFELHYNTVHRHFCSECLNSFPTQHLLDLHLLEWHDVMFDILAQKQPMFQCLVEGCALKFNSAKERKDHLVTNHFYPSNFRFNKERKVSKKKNADHTKNNIAAPSKNVHSIDGSMDVEELKDDVDQATKNLQNRVPKSICFGRGSARSMYRPRSNGKKDNGQNHRNDGTDNMEFS